MLSDLGSRISRTVVASALGASLVLVVSGTASAGPPTPRKGGHSTTTTTAKPGATNKSNATAKLVVKPDSIGHVSVQAAGSSRFSPGTDGEALHVGDTVRTDGVGRAEIDYSSDAYTRLGATTTFTIKKLTDNQGNRQVNGSLDAGQTWNRTAALTQSQSFQQDGGGTTAAVAGTAFVLSCPSPTTCTFTGVVDNVNLTGSNSQTRTLNPLDQCGSTNGVLCGNVSQLTPDQLALIQWIQVNVFLDYVEHGLGNGVFQPFSGTDCSYPNCGLGASIQVGGIGVTQPSAGSGGAGTSASRQLPFTGSSDTSALLWVGAGLVVAGGALVLVGYRRRSSLRG
jgi:LPXTG-motif cell wall-anchored protein